MLNGYFNLVLLFVLFIVSLLFLMYMNHTHNDALAQWGQGITGQFLAAILALMMGKTDKGNS